MTQKRIFSFDIFRGLAIAIIVVIHRLHYTWSGMVESNQMRILLYSNPLWIPIIVFAIVFFTMAGVFYLISGSVNSYSAFNRISEGKATSSQIMRGGIGAGILLLFINYIQRIFFMNGHISDLNGNEPEFPVGQLIGLIRSGEPVPFRWSQITDPGTLALIGWIIIIVSIILGILFRNNNFEKYERNNKILSGLAWIVLIITPFIVYLLRPIYLDAYNKGNYGIALIIGIIAETFGLFPYLGYGLLGAVIGISLARNEPIETFLPRIKKMIYWSLILGFLMVVLGDSDDQLGSQIMASGVIFVELSLFLWIGQKALLKWDIGPRKSENYPLKSKILQRFGTVTLTVYFFEPLVAEILRKMIDLIFGITWVDNVLSVLMFGFLCLFMWNGLLAIWEKSNYFGSLEWISAKILRIFAKKESLKLAI